MEKSLGKEFGRLAQGDSKTGKKGSNEIFALDHKGDNNVLADRKRTYGRLVVDYREQKADPN